MSDIVLELALKRSSGILAGIVASLARAGLEVQSQKLDRSGSGWLTIRARGDAPDPATLGERMAATRGVDRLMRLNVDGELLIADGKLVVPAIENRIEVEDLAAFTIPAASAADSPSGDEGSPFSSEEAAADAPATFAEVVAAARRQPEPESERRADREPEPPAQPQTELSAFADAPRPKAAVVKARAEALADEDDDAQPMDLDGSEPVSNRPPDPARRIQTAMRRRRRRQR